jgi:3-hydroxyisobutyrate dehydrogenase-like beta-hydroxyacid dehydrogenase
MLGQDMSVGCPIHGAAKDNGVFRRVAADMGVQTPTLDAARVMIEQAIAAGLAEADVAALIAMAYADA